MLAENILKTFAFITEDASFVEYKIAFICHFYIFVHNDKREDMQQSLTKLYQKNVWTLNSNGRRWWNEEKFWAEFWWVMNTQNWLHFVKLVCPTERRELIYTGFNEGEESFKLVHVSFKSRKCTCKVVSRSTERTHGIVLTL